MKACFAGGSGFLSYYKDQQLKDSIIEFANRLTVGDFKALSQGVGIHTSLQIKGVSQERPYSTTEQTGGVHLGAQEQTAPSNPDQPLASVAETRTRQPLQTKEQAADALSLLSSQVHLVTPPNKTVQKPQRSASFLSSLVKRLASWSMDLGIVVLMMLVVLITVEFLNLGTQNSQISLASNQLSIVWENTWKFLQRLDLTIGAVSLFIVYCFYAVFFRIVAGRTIGQALLWRNYKKNG